MAYNYDELYAQTPDALGAPTQKFVDFFDALVRTGLRVLDIGCGQGRDALFIGRLGHRVVGVDLSPSGVRDLNAAAATEELPITAIAADICAYQPDGMFDVLLIDRTLHMLSQPDMLRVLATLLDHVSDDGWVLIADEASNMAGFKTVMENHARNWKIETDRSGCLFART